MSFYTPLSYALTRTRTLAHSHFVPFFHPSFTAHFFFFCSVFSQFIEQNLYLFVYVFVANKIKQININKNKS